VSWPDGFLGTHTNRISSRDSETAQPTTPRTPGDARLGQHSVNPWLVGGTGNMVSGREPAAQRRDRLVLLGFTRSVNRR
jgi:hypothetical protein